MIMHGKIKKVIQDFGFIIPDDGGVDVFFHRSSIPPDVFAQLAPGQVVAFEVRTNAKGKTEGFNIILESFQTMEKPIPPGPQTVISDAPSDESETKHFTVSSE